MDPVCNSQHAQERVDAVQEICEWTFIDSGAGQPGNRDPRLRMVERSHVYFRFAHEEDRACPHCGNTKPGRELVDQLPPKYDTLSGHRQDYLLRVKQAGSHEQAMIEMTRENQRKIKALEEFTVSEKALSEAQAPTDEAIADVAESNERQTRVARAKAG